LEKKLISVILVCVDAGPDGLMVKKLNGFAC
jgi:hypothetical protein